jgi:hypothetical protein
MKTKAKPAPRKPKPVSAQRSPGKVLPLSPPRPIEPDHPGRVIIREALAAGFTPDADNLRLDFLVEQSPSPLSKATPMNQPSSLPSRPVPAPEPVPPEPSLEDIRYRETIPYQETRRYRGGTVSANDTVPGNDTVSEGDTDPYWKAGYLKVSHQVSDVIQARLSAVQFAIYYRLYRLSYGFQRNWCIVGNKALRTATCVKETAIREAVLQLRQYGLIEVLEVINTKEEKGTKYQINLDFKVDLESDNTKSDTVSFTGTVSANEPNKERIHDDDLYRKNHHQTAPVENSAKSSDSEAKSETTMIISLLYEELTQRPWNNKDTRELQKLAHLPSQQIEQMVKTIHNRATEPIGSFAYFAKAIIAEQKASKATPPKNALKKKYEKLAKEIRSAYVGAQNVKPSDLIAKLKNCCLREGLDWNDDIANEVLGL